MIRYLPTILFALFLLSCGQTKKNERKRIKFYQYQLWLSHLDTLDLKDSTTFLLETIETEKISKYKLRTSADDSFVAFDYSIAGDSIFYQDQYCKVLDTINLNYQGTNIQLTISDFDDLGTSDEESYLFWNSKYGLMGEYNWSMGPVLLFEPPEMKGFSAILYKYIVDHERRQQSR